MLATAWRWYHVGMVQETLLKTILASYNSKLLVPSAKAIKAATLCSKAVYKLHISTVQNFDNCPEVSSRQK